VMIVLVRRFLLSLFMITFLFAVADGIKHRYICYDCFQPHGWPWTYYHDGGFAGGNGYEWPGLVGDLAAILTMSVAVAWIWNKRKPLV